MPDPGEEPKKDYSAALTAFFARNPGAKYATDEKGPFIADPWEDQSLVLRLDKDAEPLIEALNAVYLPQPLTAIWHTDTKDLEIIWTPVDPQWDECSRSFDFQFKGRTYRCGFASSSERLLRLAAASKPSGTLTRTDHRNLREFARYVRMKAIDPLGDYQKHLTPMCFWIRDVEWEEIAVLELLRHLNFYNRYFDRKTANILIHSDTTASVEVGSSLRYPIGEFPRVVLGKQLDPYLLSLWEAVVNAPDPFRSYIYSYQILEYAAFYYLSESVAQALRRILATPELAAQPQQASRQILDALSDFKAADDEKIVAVVKQVMDPAVLWREIEPRIGAFSEETQFEGGFRVPALVRRGWSIEDFRTSWSPNLAHSLRKLRNALVHGREARTAKVVLPTKANYERLRPWRELLSVIAAQTILYEV